MDGRVNEEARGSLLVELCKLAQRHVRRDERARLRLVLQSHTFRIRLRLWRRRHLIRHGASNFYVDITKIGQISADITWIRRNRIPTTGIRISRQRSPQGRPSEFVFHGNARRRRDHRNPYFAANCGAARRGACRRLRSIF